MKSSRILLRANRTLLSRTSLCASSRTIRPSHLLRSTYPSTQNISTSQPFSTTHPGFKGLQPDTSEPAAPNPTSHAQTQYDDTPADLKDSEYHEIADQYLNTLQLVLEEKAEDPDAGYEVEFSAGVLTLGTPSGTYVINKQPPNKQIWLSSPTSGPKRYDWVIASEGQHVKEGTEMATGDDGTTGGGKWVYLRDGSTLTELLKEEIEVEVAPPKESDAVVGREGPGGSGSSS